MTTPNTTEQNSFLKLNPKTSTPPKVAPLPTRRVFAVGPALMDEQENNKPAEPTGYLAQTHLKNTYESAAINETAHAPPSLAAAGFAHIDVQAFMGGDPPDTDKKMAKKCLVGAIASFINMSRQGDAAKLQEMGEQVFDEKEFGEAMKEAFEQKK
ncbi:Hypothetical predicted protein [Lecanosticta acicola]|uniref:Uncharacterized protein n=1 Tax=Lecanosticta acicola TaxID=111012 RepID=A0AAI8Z8Z0_9PEZI|nr:Hypothetical predicted protein [Lecanosticta acicola]